MNPRLPLALALAAAPACGGTPNPVPVAGSRDVGALPFAAVVKGRDGGYSARFGDRSVWTFGDTILASAGADGSSWRTSTFTTTRDSDASDGLGPFVEPLDEKGAPPQLVPFTPQELAENLAQTPPACTVNCKKPWVLWPGPVVPAGPLGALVFYGKLRDWEGAGQGLALWPSPDRPLVRPTHRPGAPEPTLLFQAGERSPLTTALVVEGTLYGYGCEHTGFFHFDCILGRVPLDKAQERAAWRFYAGPEAGWVEDGAQAVPVLDGASILTVHWNEHAHRYLAVYAKTDNQVRFRAAEAPEGPWSAEADLHGALAPDGDGTVYDAIVHPEFSRDGGRVLYLTYSRATAPFASEMRLVEATLGAAGP